MKKATTLFSNSEIHSIEATIKTAEDITAAEIVPVIASSSGHYDRAEDLFAFFLSLLTLSLLWFGLQGNIAIDTWNSASETPLNLIMVLLILLVSFFIGLALASHFPLLRLPLITKTEMQQAVESRARETFQRLKIRGTKNANGLLIYVSLYEHMVHVVGDDAINEKLSQDDWNELCSIIITGFKENKAAPGMSRGITLCGELLAKHFPATPEDENELPDQLHLID